MQIRTTSYSKRENRAMKPQNNNVPTMGCVFREYPTTPKEWRQFFSMVRAQKK